MRWILFLLLSVAGSGREFDVTRFGAVADGVTDNTAFFQRAIDAAVNHGGGTVLAPSANAPYVIRDTLCIRGSYVEILGRGATLKLADGAIQGRTRSMILVEGTQRAPLQRVALRGLTLDANYFHQAGAGKSKAVVFRFAENALVEDVTIRGAYVGLSFRRGSNGAVARRVTVTDYQEDGFDVGGDADEVAGGVVRNVTLVDVAVRDAPRCARDGNAFEIEDGAQGVSVRNAVVENVAGSGAALRNHSHGGGENHSRDVEFRNVALRGTGGGYSILVRAVSGPSPTNSYGDVRLVDVTAEAPAAFLGPIGGLQISGGSYGEILVGVEPPGGKANPSEAVPGATLRDVTARAVRINGASRSVTLENMRASVITILSEP